MHVFLLKHKAREINHQKMLQTRATEVRLHPKFKARVWAGEEPNAPLQQKKNLYMWQLGILVLAISVGLFWRKNCFCVFWPFLVFLGVIFTQPCCFRVFLALHMTSTHPRHLPDTLRHHLMAKMQAPWQTRDDCWQQFFCFFSSSAPFLNSMFFIINFEN